VKIFLDGAVKVGIIIESQRISKRVRLERLSGSVSGSAVASQWARGPYPGLRGRHQGCDRLLGGI
jgi:hypothetical protein